MKVSFSTFFKSHKMLWRTLAVAIAVIGGGVFFSNARIDATDCSSNDIMPCGASTPSQFIAKLKANNPSDMDNIYADGRYKLSTSEYDRFVTKAKAAKINPDNGNITVNGVTVGYDAQSIGRNPKTVSHPIEIDGETYHESPIRSLTSYYNDGMVLFDQKGNVQTVIMNICGNPMTVTPNNPSYSCDALNVTPAPADRNTYTFSTNASALNGASITKVIYDFGDGTTSTQTSPTTVVSHDYGDGSFTAKVTVFVKTTFGESEFPIAVTANCQKQITVAPVPAPKTPHVTIEKTVGDKKETLVVQKDATFTYTIVIKNDGEVELKNVVVSDTAKSGIVFVSAKTGATNIPVDGNKISYTIPSLAVQQSATITITAKSTAVATTPVVNEACVETPAIPGTNPDACDTASTTTPEVPASKEVKVCDASTGNIITVKESEASKYEPENSDACKVKVCDIKDRTVKLVPKEDVNKYLPADSNECVKISVCVKESGDTTMKPIYKDQLDPTKHSTNADECKKPEVPVTPVAPVAPTIIPSTGPEALFGGLASASTLTYGAYTYAASRRAVRNAHK